ncbi:MAG TPA: hypothetical protein VN578_18110 [Candidatus Binatia bacterium]|jgi:hypothetical protein|nr:hypothetical protein [Candidatus Binatia bacterium]
METHFLQVGRAGARSVSKLAMFLLGCSGLFLADGGNAQERESSAGEKAAQALKESAQAEAGQYNIHYGPLGFQVGAGLRLGYTDNVFYSEVNRMDDFLIRPEVDLGAFMQVSELNTLKLSIKLAYEYYLRNHVLNSDAPLVNPGSELAFNLFVGDFHIRPHERFSYQESLFFNGVVGGDGTFFNFNNVGTFARLDNHAGLDVTWDLDKVMLTTGYDHENFNSPTTSFEYLDRASEWFTASAGYFLGDHVETGMEGQASWHHYEQETVLNDHWRGQGGPFMEATLLEGVKLRAGGGYDVARYDAAGRSTSDYNSWHAYGRISERTRLFSHSVEAGRENVLGDNANNMRSTYVRYRISSPIIAHVDLGANVSFNMAEESGGPSGFDENFTYYGAGFEAGYQFHKHWRANLGYQFWYKDSDLGLRNFHRNQVTVELVWSL